MPELWRCPRCSIEKSPDQFYADRPGLAGALFWCRSCVGKYVANRRKRLTDNSEPLPSVKKDAA